MYDLLYNWLCKINIVRFGNIKCIFFFGSEEVDENALTKSNQPILK